MDTLPLPCLSLNVGQGIPDRGKSLTGGVDTMGLARILYISSPQISHVGDPDNLTNRTSLLKDISDD